ncbi:MAG: two-component sensor histidine kinase [Desulfobacteraceae bacterium]|nr:two-component sensor histidine kinase [Desulfobacteraceae bacterium]
MEKPSSEIHHVMHARRHMHSTFYSRLIVLTLVFSVIPLIVVGWSIYVYYSRFSSDRLTEYFRDQAQYHRRLIELFLRERTSDLELMAYSHSLKSLQKQENLRTIFGVMNRGEPFFEDLGVQNDQGKHLAYVGPFDLMDKDYSGTFWFRELMERGVYISDMFLGYRGIPHIIVGVTWPEEDRKWILRATLFTDPFRALVEDVKMGKTGEIYLVNRQGVLQTTPRFGGGILDKAPLPMELFTEKDGVLVLDPMQYDNYSSPRQIVAYAWLSDPKWMLVARQDYDEAFRQVNHANRAMLLFLHISIVAILVVAIISIRHMIRVIRKRDEKERQLNMQLVQASKLASLGELAAGVAHEINNPLSIILAGNQVIRDCCEEPTKLDEDFKSMLLETLSQMDGQVLRCNTITHNLLRFARRSASVMDDVDINRCLEEVIALMEKRAKSSGISLERDFDASLSPFLSDPSQLQQVFVNLISNAIDAHEGKPYGTIRIATRATVPGVEISVSDTGMGIPEGNLERIFDPFFTTKPVGKGTGLGLSISYSIIQNLGGDIEVESTEGKGTKFTIRLPFLSPEKLMDGQYERKVKK